MRKRERGAIAYARLLRDAFWVYCVLACLFIFWERSCLTNNFHPLLSSLNKPMSAQDIMFAAVALIKMLMTKTPTINALGDFLLKC